MASIINFLRTLADPVRLRLLILLHQHELTVAEIQDILGMSQSRTSTHLAQLKRAGLLSDRRSGKNVYYRVADQLSANELNGSLQQILEAGKKQIPEAEQDQTALLIALDRRKDRARDYFNDLAEKYGRQYLPGRSWQALSYLLLDLLPPMRIADLGAGEGTLTQLLARRAVSVVAVDNSPKMVELAGAQAQMRGFKNIEYRLGEIESPPVADESVDLVLLSQALHHAAEPQRVLDAAWRILVPEGRIAILDLASHHFEEARELYADTWLGFAETDLQHMLEKAGFEEARTSIVYRMKDEPFLQTVMATARKPPEPV